MKESKKPPASGGEAAAVTPRWRRGGARPLAEAHDPDLLRILTHVSARRHARLTPASGFGGEADVRRSVIAPQRASRPAADVPVRSIGAPGTLIDARRVSDAVRILRVVRPPSLRFEPGQHVKLGVSGVGQNPYTIASAPDEAFLEFCIERAPNGRVSAALFTARPGDRLLLDAQAKGSFTLVTRASVHLMVATVTGIAPFRSMLRHAERRNAWPGRFVVLHGASYADELAYRAELESLAERSAGRLRYLPSVSRPTEAPNRAWQGGTGRVADLVTGALRELGSTFADIQVYACGNPDMVTSVRRQMTALRVPVVSEVFD